MGTVSHHQAKAARFLQHAQDNIAHRERHRAAQAIARAASHAATALALHRQTRHNSHRQLQWAVQSYVFDELGHGHLKTFREACDLPRRISSQPATDAHRVLLRLRRRTKSFLKAVNAIVAGQPLPIHQTRRSIRKPHEPAAPHFATLRDITTLPNFLEIRNRFRLHNSSFAAKTDPHGWYQSGRDPRPCPCHPRPRNASKNPDYIILSPLWRRALAKTFHLKLPDPLHLYA